MKLDRDKLMAYARSHWNTVCDDGVFWLSDREVNVARKRRELKAPLADGWQFLFVPDGSGGERAVFRNSVHAAADIEVWPWKGLADCAHFLSRCLTAGGVPTNILSVPKLVDALRARPDTRTLAEKVTHEQGQHIVDSGILQPGDMIGYFNISPDGDYGGAKEYSHSGLYVGKIAAGGATVGRITCHTKCRFGGLTPPDYSDEWWLPNSDGSTDYHFTFIHFSDADPRPPRGSAIAGWWTLESMPGEFIHADAMGNVYSTQRRPHSAQDGARAIHHAYWFYNGAFVFTWRETGTVQTWFQTGDDFSVTTQGGRGHQAAARLFPVGH